MCWRGSLMRVDAYVSWYPSRTAAEHIDAINYRAVAVTARVRLRRTVIRTFRRTFTRRPAVAMMAAIVNRLSARPDVVRLCPLTSSAPTYSLVFTPRER
jgi:hypothetical protein